MSSSRRSSLRSLLVVFLWFALAPARTAHAQPAVALEWSAPATCPDRNAIAAAVDRLVHAVPPSPLSARATVEHHPPRYSLRLVLEEGERELSAGTCVELAQTLVVILALAVDPSAKTDVPVAFADEATSQTSSGATSSGAPVAPPAPIVPARPARKPAERDPNLAKVEAVESRAQRESAGAPLHLGASLLLTGAVATLPAASFGPTAAGWLRRRSFAAEVGVTVLLPQFAQAPDAPEGKGGQIWLAAGQLSGCWLSLALPQLGACVGAEVGRLTGTGEGVENERQAHALWVAALATGVLRAPLSQRFSLEARLSVAVPARRPDFGLDGYGAFFTPSAVSGRGSLGISIR